MPQCSNEFSQGTVHYRRPVIPKTWSKRFLTLASAVMYRYEWQADQSLLGEDEFDFEHDWLMDRWQWHLQFWKGRRQAYAVPEEETWKCRHCSFASVCKPVKSPPPPDNMLSQSS